MADNPHLHRFEARTDDGSVAGFVEYTRDDTALVLVETQVNDGYQGMGVGSRLVGGTLDTLREQDVNVVNICPFIRRFVSRHAEQYGWVKNAAKESRGS